MSAFHFRKLVRYLSAAYKVTALDLLLLAELAVTFLPRPTPSLVDHPLSAVRDCLFNIFVATVHIGGRSSIRNLRTRLATVAGMWGYGLDRAGSG
jgi:hypothetical protein